MGRISAKQVIYASRNARNAVRRIWNTGNVFDHQNPVSDGAQMTLAGSKSGQHIQDPFN